MPPCSVTTTRDRTWAQTTHNFMHIDMPTSLCGERNGLAVRDCPALSRWEGAHRPSSTDACATETCMCASCLDPGDRGSEVHCWSTKVKEVALTHLRRRCCGALLVATH